MYYISHRRKWEIYLLMWTGLKIRMWNLEMLFLFLNQNICGGYLKEHRLNETDLLSTKNKC